MSSAVLDNNRQHLDQAMSEMNFTRDWSTLGSVSYSGNLLAHGDKYPVTIKINDFNLIKLPDIYFKEHPGNSSLLIPHILTGHQFCYATDKTMTWSNHDSPVEKIIGCILYAQTVLENIITGKLNDDITDEFSAYWHGEILLLDIADYNAQKLQACALHSEDGKEERRFNCISDDNERTKKLLAPTKLSTQTISLPTYIINLDKPLCPNTKHWPPKNLGDFSDWLKDTDNNIWKQFREQLISLNFTKYGEILIVFMHSLTQFAVSFQLDSMYKGKFRPNEKFRKFLLEGEKGRKSTIRRFTPYRIDNNFILTRGHEEHSPLAGKKVVLVGCGTIGGYLAHLLIRAGCGAEGGELDLVDPDLLLPGNIGRHLLGIEFLFQPKVSAIADHLHRDMPLAKINPIQKSIENLSFLKNTDLIIDTTGDEALSMYLNNLRVNDELPDIIHAWIDGAGLAAQTFLAQSGEACLRCLNDINNNRRFSPIKKDVDPFVPGVGCDDYYIPYPGSLSAQTAGLAANLAIDWANNNANLRLRTLRFDYNATYDQRPRNPDILERCPVCSKRPG